MDSNQLIDLFVSRGMIDRSLGQDILNQVENSGKDVAEILADFQVIQSKADVWPVVASELGAPLIDLSGLHLPNFSPSCQPAPRVCMEPFQ